MAAENESTSPTLTSTSHTLSGQSVSAMPSTATNTTDTAVLALLESLRPDNRHAFLQPTDSIPSNSLELVKKTLESFAPQVGDEQQRRLQESRKRKRKGQDDGTRAEDVLKMRKVYVDGFETSQVWQQAKKIIHGVLAHSQTALDEMEERQEAVVISNDANEVPSSESEDEEALGTDEELVPEDEEIDGLSEDEEMDGELLSGEEDLDEDDEEAEDGIEAGEEDEEEDEEDEDDEEEAQELVEDPHGLNDGFFSIDDFNKQTQWFEDQDARGDPNTDMASDDEEIDWNADPMAPQPKSAKTKKSRDDASDDGSDDGAGVEEEESEDEDDAPGLKGMDLDAPEGDSEEEDFDAAIEDPEDDEGANANEVYYKDFFAPPQRKSTGKPKKSVSFKPKQPAEGDVERAMEDVKRDLFEDSDEEDMSDDDLSDASAGDPKSRRSAHERRQAKLADEIRKLEAASVAKREWTLSGEAAAEDRPLNSLLEQDLDFEHGGKPVPVITPEITEDIESMIKRRILAQEFDEVLRRRPDADIPHDTRRGLVAVDDKKSDRGLADLYEEQHVKDANPDTYVSASDEQLRKEEKEVEQLWKSVSAQLDALSSWHYKPKPAAPAISVVSDIATVAMEDAQPATAQGVSASDSRLAPQEVYKAGSSTNKPSSGEIITKGGAPLAREEMSREDKARMRRREKEKVRKAGGKDAAKGKKPLSGKAKMKADTVAELKKGGVMVINRKGELTDVQGNKTKAVKAVGTGSYKL